METLDPECKKTKIKNINQGTYFKLKPDYYCTSMGKRRI